MKNYFFGAILSLVPFLTHAQESGKSTKLGFTVSPNLAWATDDASGAGESSVGISYGVIADVGFSPNYFWGTGFTLTSINTNIMSVRRVQYLDIPVTLKLKSNVAQRRYYGQFGLGAGIKVKEVANSSGTASKSQANPLRLGLVAGAGVEWKTSGDLSILSGITFNNGFTKVLKDYPQKNSYVSLNLGVFF